MDAVGIVGAGTMGKTASFKVTDAGLFIANRNAVSTNVLPEIDIQAIDRASRAAL
jgi:hypothetical protein